MHMHGDHVAGLYIILWGVQVTNNDSLFLEPLLECELYAQDDQGSTLLKKLPSEGLFCSCVSKLGTGRHQIFIGFYRL